MKKREQLIKIKSLKTRGKNYKTKKNNGCCLRKTWLSFKENNGCCLRKTRLLFNENIVLVVSKKLRADASN